MLHKSIISFSTALLITLFTSGCKKEAVTPPMEPLKAQIELQLSQYKQKYRKDSAGFFNLSKMEAGVAFRQSGSFFKQEEFSGLDTTLPDSELGEYNRIRFLDQNTLEQQFRSPVAGKLKASHIKCGVKFTEGTMADLEAGKSVKLSHTTSGTAELVALYSSQLEEEYGPMIKDMMWAEIENSHKDRYSAEEVRKRYRLNLKKQILASQVPESELTVTGDSASLNFNGVLFFVVSFTGKIDVIQ